jgi:AraC-like DNA-binding protein
MSSVRTVHTAWARQIVQLIEGRGQPYDLILKDLGLELDEVMDPDGRIPFAKQVALFEAAAEHLKDSCFGLHFGSSVDPLDIGVLGYVGVSSPTLGDSLRNVITYLRVSTEGVHGRLSVKDHLAFLTLEIVDPDAGPQQQITEFGLVLVMSFIRLIAGRRLIPERVQFRHSRVTDVSGFETFFGCQVQFGQQSRSIVLKRELLDLPSRSADARLLQILKDHCQEALDKRRSGEAMDLKVEVEYLVATQLHSGPPTISWAARELGMSERTLARRLAKTGTSFGQIVDDVRRQLAMRYLEEPNVRLSQIAYLLGYSSPSAFNHAFRRWTGTMPTAYKTGADHQSSQPRQAGAAALQEG